MNIDHLRQEYRLRELSRQALALHPTEQFQLWLQEAITVQIVEPNAFSLATSSPSGQPACRMVLLKYFDEKGLIFFTNLKSRKAQEIAANPSVAALFWWTELERQVTIEGKAERVSQDIVEAYFVRRPRPSQIGAWASHQDSILPDRQTLVAAFSHFERLYADKEVPPPPFWGGFRIVPSRFEFWQGRESRLHDRFQYVLEGSAWKIDRLSP
jgi:pyridoxamine 5'-phosphate oxidase